MQLLPVGADVWYVDESTDEGLFALTAFSVPLLRSRDGGWHISWDEEFEKVRLFRRALKKTHSIPMRKELHAVKLVSGRGRFRNGKEQFGRRAAAAVFRSILAGLDFLPDSSVITVAGSRNVSLYGHTGLTAIAYALFQRMARASRSKNGMTFFDEGHGEYRKMYRKARIFLPTGSSQGGWPSGQSVNMPMSGFFKDANFKQSHHSWFIQLADLIAYAAFLKAKARAGRLEPWQQEHDLGRAYDSIPPRVLNLLASRYDPQGIVWLGL